MLSIVTKSVIQSTSWVHCFIHPYSQVSPSALEMNNYFPWQCKCIHLHIHNIFVCVFVCRNKKKLPSVIEKMKLFGWMNAWMDKWMFAFMHMVYWRFQPSAVRCGAVQCSGFSQWKLIKLDYLLILNLFFFNFCFTGGIGKLG